MGCFTFRLHNPGNDSHVATSEPENSQTLLATKFQDYDIGPLRKTLFKEIIGDGIFTADSEEWAQYRRQLKPQFNRDQVSDLESTGHHVDILFKSLPGEDSQGWTEVPDMMPYIYRFTMDVSTEFLLDILSIHTLGCSVHKARATPKISRKIRTLRKL
jgi:cytochrome P450